VLPQKIPSGKHDSVWLYPVSLTSSTRVSMPAWRAKNGSEVANATLRANELLALPQDTYTVTGDPSFAGPTRISGVLRKELIRRLGAAKDSDLIVALSHDPYCAHYPRAYIERRITPPGAHYEWKTTSRLAEGCGRIWQRYGPLHGLAS
jgi:hypothetical protein